MIDNQCNFKKNVKKIINFILILVNISISLHRKF